MTSGTQGIRAFYVRTWALACSIHSCLPSINKISLFLKYFSLYPGDEHFCFRVDTLFLSSSV